jgi:cytochrome c peroxidase
MLLLTALVGCEPARRYPPKPHLVPEGQPQAASPVGPPAAYAWRDGKPTLDLPIRFVHADTHPAEWKRLPSFWNRDWGGAGTAHLGLPPLQALAALRLGLEREEIRIKVPLGLPDPTPHIPASNPPTYLKWRLGKRLFFDKGLLPGSSKYVSYACADCHNPTQGFTVHRSLAPRSLWNPPSLINCAYNRRQFWDGRVATLEEVIQRRLEDELPLLGKASAIEPPEERHIFFGVVHRLDNIPDYVQEFGRAFGARPTQDSVARALATYLRTILSGASVYDRARAEQARRGGKELEVRDFTAALDQATLKALVGPGRGAGDVGRELQTGHELFRGKARCAACHDGPLFTDHDYHNVGVGESRSLRNDRPGQQTGRFPHQPIGQKDRRSIGAFRTPTLRALPRTGPYMHDGALVRLEDVIGYFNTGLWTDINPFLDPLLRDGSQARRLGLEAPEVSALALFLRALDGEPVDAVVAAP